jgi:hypothetical protein
MKPNNHHVPQFSFDLMSKPFSACVSFFHISVFFIAVFIYQDLHANQRSHTYYSEMCLQPETPCLKNLQTVESDSGKLDFRKNYLSNTYPNQMVKGSISGRFFSIRNKADTILLKHVDFPEVTDSGYYRLELDFGTYRLCPKKYSEYYDSVSTYDIIRIQRHILGIQTFDDAYQFYAADVNRSSSITASDLSEIRKLVLRNIDSFRNSSPWLVSPVVPPLPASCKDVVLGMDQHIIVNFRGIKTGDVNNLVSSDHDQLLIPNAGDSLRFKIINQLVKKGDTVLVDFYSDNFYNISGFQFTLKIDTQFLSFLNIIPGHGAHISAEHFGIRYIDMGLLTSSWNSLRGLNETYKPDEILFTLQFIAKNESELCDLLSLTSQLTPAEAYRDSFLLNNMILEICDDVINTNEKNKEPFRVFPNPVHQQMTIQFSDTQYFPLDIQMYSMSGRLLEQFTIKEPMANWFLSVESLNQGVYLLSLKSKQNQHFLKFIKY